MIASAIHTRKDSVLYIAQLIDRGETNWILSMQGVQVNTGLAERLPQKGLRGIWSPLLSRFEWETRIGGEKSSRYYEMFRVVLGRVYN